MLTGQAIWLSEEKEDNLTQTQTLIQKKMAATVVATMVAVEMAAETYREMLDLQDVKNELEKIF
jgi:PIN domain nuclease of toxin-antitoxin system